MFSFNDYIHLEKLDKEYKTFSLNLIQPDLSIEECEKLCYENKFDFSRDVIKNIYAYIEKYVPRYVCGYLNSNISGSLYIGVDNNGYIKGIPFQGDLPIDEVTKYINNVIDKHIDGNIKANISINITQINKPAKPLEVIHPRFVDYIEKKKIHNKLIEKYNKEVAERRRLLELFDNKLVNIYNNAESRTMLIDYIREKDSTNNVINLLNQGHQLTKLEGGIVKVVKYDVNHPYYWVTIFKDDMIDKIIATKPERAPYFKEMMLPFNLIRSVNDMIPWWMHYNDNMNLYVIHIKVNNKKRRHDSTEVSCEKKSKITYLNPKTNEWSESYRMLDNKGLPMCTY